MSYLAFHTRCGDYTEVRGAERHHMSWMINAHFWGLCPQHDIEDIEPWVIGFDREIAVYKELLYQEQYSTAGDYKRQIIDSVRCAMNVSYRAIVKLKDGTTTTAATLAANTALKLSGEPMQLFARLHAQCELNAWVAGKNRAWMAGVIEDGLELGLYRDGMGWEKVVDLLRKSKRGSVVTEYSVTDSFNWNKDKLSEDTEIAPDKPVHFDGGHTVFDLAKATK